MLRTAPGRRGLTIVEVLLGLFALIVVVLLLAMALPRNRESARIAGCERNLMQIGVALTIYGGSTDQYPTVPPSEQAGPSPLEALLVHLGQDDFRAMADPERPPPPRRVAQVGPRYITGFVCPADNISASGTVPSPLSYRATAGTSSRGNDGPFAFGRLVRPGDVEAGDGLGFTAAFSERLVGTGREGEVDARNYALAPGTIEAACPDAPPTSWRGDTGASWDANWRSSLYNHGLTPNGSPSCIADDGRTARIGASSLHPRRVHLLILDGGVRAFTPTIDPAIWRAWADIRASSRGKAN